MIDVDLINEYYKWISYVSEHEYDIYTSLLTRDANDYSYIEKLHLEFHNDCASILPLIFKYNLSISSEKDKALLKSFINKYSLSYIICFKLSDFEIFEKMDQCDFDNILEIKADDYKGLSVCDYKDFYSNNNKVKKRIKRK